MANPGLSVNHHVDLLVVKVNSSTLKKVPKRIVEKTMKVERDSLCVKDNDNPDFLGQGEFCAVGSR